MERRHSCRRKIRRQEWRRSVRGSWLPSPMNAEAAIDIFKTLVTFALYVMSPFLGLILVVGLVTSLLQSITSIQEQTLTFVPKLVACAGLLLLLAPWLLRMLGEFAAQSFARMATMGP